MNATFTRAIILVLIVSFVVPAAFFVAPRRASAGAPTCIGGLLGSLFGGGAGVAAKILAVPVTDPLNTVVNSGTMGNSYATCFTDLVVVPLVRKAIKSMIQKMTNSVISWINGSNSSGAPSYVGNLSTHLQSVGDSAGVSFIQRVQTGINTEFSSAISRELAKVYLHGSSQGGYFTENQNTLPGTPQSQQAFLAGTWSQGGVASWFALTTHPENNPYMLMQSAQTQLNNSVNDVQTNRRQDLIQSNGFLSMCPAGSSSNYLIVTPQAPCTNADGTPVQSVTPGSVIHDYAAKAVADAGFDQAYAQLISANDIDSALNQIVNVVIDKVLGSAQGLIGAAISTPGRASLTSSLQNYADTSTNATQSADQTAQAMTSQIAAYTAAWSTITASANTTKTALLSLQNTCTNNAQTASAQIQSQPFNPGNATLQTFVTAATAQAADAAKAITSEVDPVLALGQTAISVAANAQAFVTKIQSEIASNSPALVTDASTLLTMSPSMTDVNVAQSNATAGGSAAALPRPVPPDVKPTISLDVTGGTTVDQMALIAANAASLQTSVCTIPVIPSTTL